MSGILYVVGTPIGNLGDMTFRAVEVLKSVNFIAAEDTRVTFKLLNHFNIVNKPMISYFEHNKIERGRVIIHRIKTGEDCALVTDAGMPAISDPGEKLVEQCHKEGIDIKVVPGASACVSALCVSGLPTGRFCFEGFLSVNKKRRHLHLSALREEPRTMIFYEAPHKLLNTLKDLYDFLGNRKVSVIHELTKIHESIFLSNIDNAIKFFSNTSIKGEYVIVVDGHEQQQKKPLSYHTINDAIEMVISILSQGKETLSSASKKVSLMTGISRNNIYNGVLEKYTNQFRRYC